MKYKQNLILITLVLLTFFSSFVLAEINEYAPVRQGECVDIKQVCASCSYINLSVSYPNSSLAVINEGMVDQGGGTWLYNFCETSELGRYDVTGSGDLLGTDTGFDVLWFEVTPDGQVTNGWKIAIKIFTSLSALLLMILFLYLSTNNLKNGSVSTEEKPVIRFFFLGVAFIFLIAHIIITNIILHDTLGIGSITNAYTSIMYIFFTILIFIFLFTLVKIAFYEVTLFQQRRGLR